MAPIPKILNHPKIEDITRWLLDGVSVREVESRLNQLFPGPEEAHLRCSFSTIQNFRKEHLQIQDRVLEDIKSVSQITKDTVKREIIQAEVEATSAYKAKLNEIVDEKLEVTKELTKIFTIMEARIEKIYNAISKNEFIDGKLERLLIAHMEQIQGALEKYSKHTQLGYGNETNINISIDVANEQISLLREIVRETLSDVDPALSVRFMEKLHNRLATLTYRATDYDGALLEAKDG